MITKQVKLYEPLYWSREKALTIRIVMLCVLVTACFMATFKLGLYRFAYLTVQAELLMIVYTVTAILHYQLNDDRDVFLTRFKGVVMHLVLSIQLNVALLYWMFMVPRHWEKIRSLSPMDGRIEFTYSLIAHGFLPLYVWFNLATERTNLKYSNISYLIVYCCLYWTLNFLVSLSKGSPVYPGINWKNSDSLLKVIASILVSCLGFYLAAYLSQSMNQRLGFFRPTLRTNSC